VLEEGAHPLALARLGDLGVVGQPAPARLAGEQLGVDELRRAPGGPSGARRHLAGDVGGVDSARRRRWRTTSAPVAGAGERRPWKRSSARTWA
jgi:hypothetical protein